VFGPLGVLAGAGFVVSLVTNEGARPATSAHGCVAEATQELGAAPELLVVPGGGWAGRAERGAWAEARRGVLPRVVAQRFAAGSTVAAVSTGAMLVAGAGLLSLRPAVTHHAALDELAAAGAEVVRHARVVDDGRLVTAGGVTAGIDLALWLVERELGPAAAAAQAARLEHPRVGTVWQRPAAGTPPAAGGEASSLALPETPLARAARDLAAAEPPALYNHSVRSYLFARGRGRGGDGRRPGLRRRAGLPGLRPARRGPHRGSRPGRAVRSGRRRGSGSPCCAPTGWAPTGRTWSGRPSPCTPRQASPSGVPPRSRSPAEGFASTSAGTPTWCRSRRRRQSTRAIPAWGWRCLTDAIVGQASRRPGKAPRYSMPGELVRERATGGETDLERETREGRWGE
jgi:putative intracellular protease/amidase